MRRCRPPSRPPIATARYLRAVYGEHGVHITYIGGCPSADDATIDARLTPDAFLADIAEWPTFNEIYAEFFKKPFPARSALAASGLARDARVEVECIAYVPR